MSVTWKCNRCSKLHEDRAAMVSHPPESWKAYQLTEVATKHGSDFNAMVLMCAHLCDHCQIAVATKAPAIKFD